MSTSFILALFALPAGIMAAAVWLASRTRPGDLGTRTGIDDEQPAPGGADR